MEIYEPAEDSFLISELLEEYLSKQNKEIKYLDMGTGSGILALTASNFLPKENILASDINPKSVKLLKEQGFNAVKSNLFQNIKDNFDLITFNAPYLPEDSREPKSSRLATTGGKKGDEIAVEFLKQAKSHLNKDGKIFLLISNLTPIDKIKKFKPKIAAKKKIFMEELIVFEFS